MTRSMALAETTDPRGGYVVRRPISTDALGMTLRGAFGNDERLPRALVELLRRLDAVPERL